jgi:DNA-directed RNA polymerase beta subunit
MSKSQPIIGDYKISEDDVLLVGYAELDEKTLVYHQLSSANDFYSVGLRQIITQVFKVEREFINLRDSTPEDTEIEKIHMLIKFTDVFVNKPTTFTFPSGKEELLFPNEALRKDKTYSASLKVNAVIKVTATLTNGTTKVRDDVIKDWMLCKIPIMKGSKLCNTYGMSKESLMQLKEDPLDIGGYYIASGIERTVDSVENILFNQIRIFKNNYGKELLRIGFVSKPGDTYQNSDYFIGRFLRDGQITCEILRDKLKELQIPFYLIYRALGWTTDKEMIDNIVYGYDDAISKNMLNFIIEAMGVKYNKLSHYRYEYNQHNILRAIVNEFKDREFEYLKLNENPENYQIAIKNILYILDTNFLPHVGTTKNDRHKKLRYLSLMIRKLLLTHMNILKPSDRDTFKSKRVHTAGTNYAKAFKTYFNAAIVQQIKRRLVRDFRAIPFSKIDLAASVKNSVLPHEFEKSIIQALTTGSKSQITINKKPRTNHMSSQLLSRKNQLAALTTLRQIIVTTSDSSKQSERAHDMRRVHMSALGYVCNVHSPEGEKVGVNKQIAIFASIVGSTSSEILKDTLVNDKSVNPLDTITHKDIYDNDLSNVFVNGDWIGCTRDSFKLADKYRKMRRDLKIHPMTTIYWDNTQDELYFWVDVGRMIRPLLIVYNNKRDPEMFPAKLQKENSPFTQGLALTSSHVKKLQSKEIDIEYLLKNKIIEYITAEEQENCYLCYAL